LNNPAIANPTATPLNDIAYILSIQRGVCIDTLFQTIELEDLEIAVSEDLLLCGGGEVILELITANNLEVTWSSSPAFVDMLNDTPGDYSINPIVTETTTFYVLAQGELCSETAEVQVAVFTDYVELEGDLNICAGDTIEVSVVQPMDGLTYTWTPAANVISGQGTSEVLVTTDEGIVLTVEASSSGCEVEDSITIGVINDTGDTFIVTATPPTIISGQESQLSVSVTGLEYTWQPSETLNNSGIQNPIATPLETTTYLVTAGTGDCVRSGVVTVTVVDFICGEPLIFMPNAFSPNSDNENDVLYVYGQNLTEVHLAIFNRWGQKVFETYDQSIGWDGLYNGKMSSPAVFDYYLEVTCKGNVTLVR
jgi:gliding motility-associated-like protein